MSLSIRTNVASLNAQRNLGQTQSALDSSLSKLSSGFRITKAGDDAAGLGISTKLEAQIRSYAQAARNANDGMSLIQSTEAALNETANMLTRLRELAMQSASDGIGTDERGYVGKEATALVAEIERIANVTEFNGTKVLNGGGSSLDFQVGIAADAAGADPAFNKISVSVLNAKTDNLGTADSTEDDGQGGTVNVTGLKIADIDLTNKADALLALASIDDALKQVSGFRADLGAAGNRFQSAINNIQAFSESLSAANSRIKDVDIAEETSKMSRAQILAQAGVSVLAQANQMPQMALKLLG